MIREVPPNCRYKNKQPYILTFLRPPWRSHPNNLSLALIIVCAHWRNLLHSGCNLSQNDTMKLHSTAFDRYLRTCVEGFFYGMISILSPKLLKQPNITPVPGFYSGIFIMYLHYNASRKDVNKGSNIIFYALCLLYVLSSATFVFDIANFPLFMVSKNEYLAQLCANEPCSTACRILLATLLLLDP